MIVPFDQLPDSARVWVFQADSLLNTEQQQFLASAANTFLSQWQAHGQELTTSYTILHNYFFIISVDESLSGASGCSIDKLTQFVIAAGSHMGVDFFNRSKVVLVEQDSSPFLQDILACETYFSNETAGQFSFFNNVISTKYQLENEWLLPLNNSWISRKFQKMPIKSM